MPKIKIKQLKSPIGRNNKQRETLISLGLNKINGKEKIRLIQKRTMIDKPSQASWGFILGSYGSMSVTRGLFISFPQAIAQI